MRFPWKLRLLALAVVFIAMQVLGIHPELLYVEIFGWLVLAGVIAFVVLTVRRDEAYNRELWANMPEPATEDTVPIYVDPAED